MALMRLVETGANALVGWIGGPGETPGGGPWATPESHAYGAGANVSAPVYGHGGVFAAGSLVPFARGGIIDAPTLFPFARGTGLMGEAGPEAIVPLKRMPTGNLGLEAGGGGIVNNVTVINNHPYAQVTAQERQNPGGGVSLDIMVDALEQAMAARGPAPARC